MTKFTWPKSIGPDTTTFDHEGNERGDPDFDPASASAHPPASDQAPFVHPYTPDPLSKDATATPSRTYLPGAIDPPKAVKRRERGTPETWRLVDKMRHAFDLAAEHYSPGNMSEGLRYQLALMEQCEQEWMEKVAAYQVELDALKAALRASEKQEGEAIGHLRRCMTALRGIRDSACGALTETVSGVGGVQ